MPLIRAVKGRSTIVRGGLSSRADLVTFSNYCTANAMGPFFYEVPNLLAAPNYNAALSCAEFRDSSLMMIPVSTTPNTFPYYDLDPLYAGFWPGVTNNAMTQFPSLSNNLTYFIVFRKAPGLSAYNWRRPPGTIGLRTTGWPSVFGAINYAGIPSNTLSFWHDEKSDAEALGLDSQSYYHPGTQLALLSTPTWPPGAPASNSQITNATLIQNSNYVDFNVSVTPSLAVDNDFLIYSFVRDSGTLKFKTVKTNAAGNTVTSTTLLTGGQDPNGFTVLPFSLNVSPPEAPPGMSPANRLFGLSIGSYSPAGIGLYGLSATQYSFTTFDFPGLQITVTHAPTGTAVGDGRPGADITLTNPRANQYGTQTSTGSISFKRLVGGWNTPPIDYTVKMTSPSSQTRTGDTCTFDGLNQNTTYTFEVYDGRAAYSSFKQFATITTGNNGAVQTARLEPRNVTASTIGYGVLNFSQIPGRYNDASGEYGKYISGTGGVSPTHGILTFYSSKDMATQGLLTNNNFTAGWAASDTSTGWQKTPAGVNLLPVLSTNVSSFLCVALSSAKLWNYIRNQGALRTSPNAAFFGLTSPITYPALRPNTQYPFPVNPSSTSNFISLNVPYGQFLGTGWPLTDYHFFNTGQWLFGGTGPIKDLNFGTTINVCPIYWTTGQPLNIYSTIFLDDPESTPTNKFGRYSRTLETVTDSVNNPTGFFKNAIVIRLSGFSPDSTVDFLPFPLEPGRYKARFFDSRWLRHPMRALSGGPYNTVAGYEDTYLSPGAPAGTYVFPWAYPWFPYRDIEFTILPGIENPATIVSVPPINVQVWRQVIWNDPSVGLFNKAPLISYGAKQPFKFTIGLGGLENYGTSYFRLSLSGCLDQNSFVTFSTPITTISLDTVFQPGTQPGYFSSSGGNRTITPINSSYSFRVFDANPNIISNTRSRGYQIDASSNFYMPYAFGWVPPNQGLFLPANLPVAFLGIGPFQTAATRYENYMCNIPISADIREIMFYNRALTESEIDRNIAYLYGKWRNK